MRKKGMTGRKRKRRKRRTRRTSRRKKRRKSMRRRQLCSATRGINYSKRFPHTFRSSQQVSSSSSSSSSPSFHLIRPHHTPIANPSPIPLRPPSPPPLLLFSASIHIHGGAKLSPMKNRGSCFFSIFITLFTNYRVFGHSSVKEWGRTGIEPGCLVGIEVTVFAYPHILTFPNPIFLLFLISCSSYSFSFSSFFSFLHPIPCILNLFLPLLLFFFSSSIYSSFHASSSRCSFFHLLILFLLLLRSSPSLVHPPPATPPFLSSPPLPLPLPPPAPPPPVAPPPPISLSSSSSCPSRRLLGTLDLTNSGWRKTEHQERRQD